jgi:hypothetical protein
MTREEARKYIGNCVWWIESGADDPDVSDTMMTEYRRMLHAAIDAEIAVAVRDEREACAQIAGAPHSLCGVIPGDKPRLVSMKIAAAIRARGGKPWQRSE